ncbi:MAG: Gfo/Idh/MocA family protein [Actinomycetota bacterium]
MARQDHVAVSVAVVGAGGWGRNLVRTLHELGALSAVADVDPTALEAAEPLAPGVRTFGSLDEVLATDVPAVAIATPAFTHAEAALLAIVAGKDVFVEKPLALGVEDGARVVRAARERDRILMVGHMLLYQPAVRALHDLIRDGALGEVCAFHQERLNLGRARIVENALWSLGVHDVAVLLSLAGEEPERTSAWGQCALRPDIEDDVHVHLRFPGGVHAHLHASWLWPEKRRRLTVIGSEAMAVYDEADQRVVLHYRGITRDLANRNDGSEVAFEGDAEPLRAELEHFLACVRDRTVPLTDGESALAVLRVLGDASDELARMREVHARG